jgi:putative flippase GtrA
MKKDFLTAGIAGLFTAIFILPIFKNIKIFQPAYIIAGFVIGLPILWMLILATANFLKNWLGWIYQFAKFCIVGFLNASIDFGILNLLSWYTGLTSGFIIGGVNVPGFIVAATNSYFWNKFWVFSHTRQPGEKVSYGNFWTFAAVAVSGALINSGIVIFVSTYIHPLFGLTPSRWLNIGKVIASALALLWNFLGFKFFVFKGIDSQNQSR